MTRDREEDEERIMRLERQRQQAMEACKTISSAVRNNRTTSVTRHIGTLTMLFGAATSVGLIVFKEPTLANIFSSVALAGFAIGGNRKIHRSTTLKMNMHKQMVILAENRYNELSGLDVAKNDIQDIPIPKYSLLEREAREIVDKDKKKILKKSNYKTIKNTMTSFLIIGGLGAIINYAEQQNITNIEDAFNNYIDDLTAEEKSNPAPKTSLRPRTIPSI